MLADGRTPAPRVSSPVGRHPPRRSRRPRDLEAGRVRTVHDPEARSQRPRRLAPPAQRGRDGDFDTTLADQLVAKLMAEVEVLSAERDHAKAELLVQLSAVLEGRLKDLDRLGPQARWFITYLRGNVTAKRG